MSGTKISGEQQPPAIRTHLREKTAGKWIGGLQHGTEGEVPGWARSAAIVGKHRILGREVR
jgi:hypothetical protein